MAAAMPAVVALTRRKGMRHPTIATIPRHHARTLRPLVPIPRPAGPTQLRAAATAEVALRPRMQAVAVAPRTVAVAELPMAVAAVLTAIVKISGNSSIQKGPPLFE